MSGTAIYILCPKPECKTHKTHMTLVGERGGRCIFKCDKCGTEKSLSQPWIAQTFVIGDCGNGNVVLPPLPRQCLHCNAPGHALRVQPGQVSADCGQCGGMIVHNQQTGEWEKVE